VLEGADLGALAKTLRAFAGIGNATPIAEFASTVVFEAMAMIVAARPIPGARRPIASGNSPAFLFVTLAIP
jgi:hypothetical protein